MAAATLCLWGLCPRSPRGAGPGPALPSLLCSGAKDPPPTPHAWPPTPGPSAVCAPSAWILILGPEQNCNVYFRKFCWDFCRMD